MWGARACPCAGPLERALQPVAREIARRRVAVATVGVYGKHGAAVDQQGWRSRYVLAHREILGTLVDVAQRPEIGIGVEVREVGSNRIAHDKSLRWPGGAKRLKKHALSPK